MPSWKVNTRVFLTRQILFFFFAKMWFKDCSSVLYFGSVFCKPATLGRVRRWKASELSAMLVSSLAVVRRYRKKIWFLDHSLKVQGIMAECRVMGNPNITTGQEAWHSVPSLSPFSLLFSPARFPAHRVVLSTFKVDPTCLVNPLQKCPRHTHRWTTNSPDGS